MKHYPYTVEPNDPEELRAVIRGGVAPVDLTIRRHRRMKVVRCECSVRTYDLEAHMEFCTKRIKG